MTEGENGLKLFTGLDLTLGRILSECGKALERDAHGRGRVNLYGNTEKNVWM